MSEVGKNEIFDRNEGLQEVPSTIVISEDSEGQGSMDFFRTTVSSDIHIVRIVTIRILAVHGSQVKVRAIIMKKIKVWILLLLLRALLHFHKKLGD